MSQSGPGRRQRSHPRSTPLRVQSSAGCRRSPDACRHALRIRIRRLRCYRLGGLSRVVGARAQQCVVSSRKFRNLSLTSHFFHPFISSKLINTTVEAIDGRCARRGAQSTRILAHGILPTRRTRAALVRLEKGLTNLFSSLTETETCLYCTVSIQHSRKSKVGNMLNTLNSSPAYLKYRSRTPCTTSRVARVARIPRRIFVLRCASHGHKYCHGRDARGRGRRYSSSNTPHGLVAYLKYLHRTFRTVWRVSQVLQRITEARCASLRSYAFEVHQYLRANASPRPAFEPCFEDCYTACRWAL